MGPDALTREKLRSDGNLVDGFKRAWRPRKRDRAASSSWTRPPRNPPTASPSSRRSFPEMLDVLGPDELEKVRRNLVAVADKVEELIGEIDERA